MDTTLYLTEQFAPQDGAVATWRYGHLMARFDPPVPVHALDVIDFRSTSEEAVMFVNGVEKARAPIVAEVPFQS